jgi:dimethylsulfone monooxygenase
VSTAKINGILSPDARDRTATPSARNCWYGWVQLGPIVDDMVGRTVSWGDMDSMTSDSTTSPGDTTARARLFGGNRLKLGFMAFNCSHGSTITTVPEAWKLNWADTVDIAQAVDRSGMEALLPVGRWRGYGGPSDFNSTTFESFTWAAARGSLTKYVTVLATCHVPLVHPLMVAKMASTIDHVTNGRFALNVVCGWFKNEFDMFGADMRPHDDRYKYATEWLQFLKQAWTDDAEFDFESDNFHARNVWSQPKPLQKPHPPVMNAGGSTAAQDFTTRHCDMNFVILKDRTFLEGAQKQIAHLKTMAHSHGRETRIWIHVYVVCRETEKEAKDYLHRYVYEQGDWEAAGNLLRIFGMQTETLDPETLEGHKAHFIAGHGGYPLVGTAGQIADELCKLADIGVDGCLISWVDYKNELEQWNAEVLPLLEQSGLRQPFRPGRK